jgi:molybdopterin-guanine dinucleotide biosynthesis protein A
MVPPIDSKTRDRSTHVVGVVLAGGASTRFGADKAMAQLAGEPLVRHALRTLGRVCADVVLADGGRALVAGVESIEDGPGQGPAAGILGAAARRPGQTLLVLACDLPAVPVTLLERLLEHDGDWVVPRVEGKLEPLCALYRPRALDALLAQVGAGDHALHRLDAADLRRRHVDAEELAEFGDPDALFLNVNTPDDLRRLDRGDPAARRPGRPGSTHRL